MTMTLIETKTLSSAAASIEFTAIPQDGTDLYAVASLRDASGTVGWVTCEVRPNGSSSNLNSRALYGFGTTVGSLNETTAIYHQATQGGNTANTFSNSSIYISNYTSSVNKAISVDTSTEGNTTNTINAITAGLWSNSAAITSLTFIIAGQNLAAGSTISLYKINRFVMPTAKATGGTITYGMDGYFYHTFTSSGTFTPTVNLTGAEILMIGGGGGKVQFHSGGGGAGGLLVQTASLTASTNYTAAIGGGSSGTGQDTIFTGLTTAKGGGVGASSGGGGAGGSGGGGGGGAGTGSGGAGTAGQGTNGGGTSANNAGGGGGGSGGGGGQGYFNGSVQVGGDGGAATTLAVWAGPTNTGVSSQYAGGGGGSSTANGGSGGGGAGPTPPANSGSGGGSTNNTATGGSGLIIVRYVA
jgi:hypothetical protein